MKFSFRKIGSVLASTAMLTSTVALAAAANFPAPFVTSAGADVAIVHGGANAAFTDLVAVADVTSYLSSELASKTGVSSGTSTATTEGETAALFSSGTKLYVNDSLNTVKSVLTKTELPTILKDTSFSGDVERTVTHTIALGANPRVIFARQPASSDDPLYALSIPSSTSAGIIYNASASFQTINFTHANTKGQTIEMFGQTFTIGSATDTTKLVLLKSAEKVDLTSDDPSAEVTIAGAAYTVELISSSDTSATIKVTNSAGVSATKEVSEAASKKINGLTIAVDTADETNLKLSASVIAGAEKITITDGSQVTKGDDDSAIDGTTGYITGGTSGATKITISVVASGSDVDAVKPGASLTDLVFGTFKLDFAGMSIADDSTTAREDIKITPAGNDKIELTMTDKVGNEKTIQFARNLTATAGGIQLQHDSDMRNITVLEAQPIYYGEMVVVGNQEEGRLIKLTTATNQTTSYTSDKVVFTDVFRKNSAGDSETYTASLTSEGDGTITIGGKVFNVNYFGANGIANEQKYVRLNYPDSSTAATQAIIYPTIMTSKGALLSFYEPTTIALANWDGDLAGTTLSTLKFPDGDGYTDVTFSDVGGLSTNGVGFNFTCGTTVTRMNSSGLSDSATCGVGQLTYNITVSAANQTTISLMAPGANTAIKDAGLVIFEEKDDNTRYEALVVTLDQGTTSSNSLDVGDVYRTWLTPIATGTNNFRDTLSSDGDITKEGDLFGAIVSLDSNTAGQKKAIISYPDEQIQAQMYIGAIASAVSGGTTSGGITATKLGSVAVTDSEASSVAAKNLVVIGGSCVNSVAAELLGVASPTCGADFTAKTSVGSGQYLIETFSRTGGKVATLVAGYNAGDTTNAAKALTTQTIDTTAGKKYTGTTSSDVTASVASTTGTETTTTA